MLQKEYFKVKMSLNKVLLSLAELRKYIVQIKGNMLDNVKEIVDVKDEVMLLKKVKEYLENSSNEVRKKEEGLEDTVKENTTVVMDLKTHHNSILLLLGDWKVSEHLKNKKLVKKVIE